MRVCWLCLLSPEELCTDSGADTALAAASEERKHLSALHVPSVGMSRPSLPAKLALDFPLEGFQQLSTFLSLLVVIPEFQNKSCSRVELILLSLLV